jgi:hypothetical protein
MSGDNVTPISAARRPNEEMKRLLQEQVGGAYRPRNLVGTTLKSIDERDSDRIGTLEVACEVLDKLAEDLDEISYLRLNPPKQEE